MSNISDVIKTTHDFFNEEKQPIFAILPNKEKQEISIYLKSFNSIDTIDKLKSLYEKKRYCYSIFAKCLNYHGKYFDILNEDFMVKNGLLKTKVSNPGFEKIKIRMENVLKWDGEIYKDVYFYENNLQLTKMDLIFKNKKACVLFAFQEISGKNTSKNTKRKLRKLRIAQNFLRDFYKINTKNFRTVIKDKNFEIFNVIENNGNILEQQYNLKQLTDYISLFTEVVNETNKNSFW